ncbi:flagellar motor switch protein FliM [Pseudoxanthomonas winnipegensis]
MMSNELLSQDEIDALLHGVDSGAVGTGQAAAPGEVRLYDFKQAGRAIRNRLPGLDALNERFVRNFRTGLFNLLRRAPELTYRGTDVLRFDEYANALPMPASVTRVHMAPLKGTALVVYEPRLVFSTVENFFGGAGRLPARIDNREFTPTEQRVIQLMLKQTLADLAEAWTPLAPVALSVLPPDPNLATADLMDGRDYIAVSRFSVALEGGGGDLHLAMPYKMLEPVREQLEVSSKRPKAEADAGWSRALRAGLQDADLELSLSIAHRQISLRDLSRLRVGDIIPIELARPVHLEVERTPMFAGEFGVHNGFNAFKVTQVQFPRVPSSNDSPESDLL